MALFAILMLCTGLFASAVVAAPGNSVFDYAQCANDKPESATSSLDCVPKGWINGILNTNNSQYAEDQVTAQRLFVDISAGGNHSFDFAYLVRKGIHHAYDSLATWNFTQTGANPCQGFNGPTLNACVTATGGTPSLLDIDADGLDVPTSCTTTSADTAAHQLAGQKFTMFGGTLTDMGYTGTTADSQDLYQGVHIEFTTAGAGRVYFLFGGHLAAGKTPATGSPRGWGAGCGAADVSGGPYHIKLNAIDGASAGNRDNQIMSNAILPIPPETPTLTTDPDSSFDYSVTLSDSLDVNNALAGGMADFYLYDNATDCNANTTANAVGSAPAVTVSGGTAASGDITVDPGPSAQTTYYWFVHYSGDSTITPNLLPTDSVCTETTVVTPPSTVDAGS
jgi:hypothetical protein